MNSLTGFLWSFCWLWNLSPSFIIFLVYQHHVFLTKKRIIQVSLRGTTLRQLECFVYCNVHCKLLPRVHGLPGLHGSIGSTLAQNNLQNRLSTSTDFKSCTSRAPLLAKHLPWRWIEVLMDNFLQILWTSLYYTLLYHFSTARALYWPIRIQRRNDSFHHFNFKSSAYSYAVSYIRCTLALCPPLMSFSVQVSYFLMGS